MPRWISITVVLVLVLLTGATRVSAADAVASRGPASPVRTLRYDGPGQGPDYPAAVAVAPDGRRVYVAGSAYGGPPVGDDYTTTAYRPDRRRVWRRSYNGPDSNIDQALDVAVSPNGETVFVTGYSFGGPATTNDATTVAYEKATRDELWAP